MLKINKISSPVVYNFFLRTDIINRVFRIIQDVKPGILILVSDGPRNLEENNLIQYNRKFVEGLIDWDCKVFRLYFDSNLGMDSVMIKTYEFVFESFDRMIFLEEDILPSVSFFYFVDEMLEKYLNDDSIYLVGGMNFLGEYKLVPYSYFFVETTSSWGYGFWKRSYDKLQYNLDFVNDEYLFTTVKLLLLHKRKKYVYQHLMMKLKEPNRVDYDGEFWMMGLNDNIFNNSLAIVPSKNLVVNIGLSENSENSDQAILYPKSSRRNSNLKLYNINDEIKHPIFKIADFHYYKLLKMNNKKIPVYSSIHYYIERSIRIILYIGIKGFAFRLKKKIKRIINYELRRRRY